MNIQNISKEIEKIKATQEKKARSWRNAHLGMAYSEEERKLLGEVVNEWNVEPEVKFVMGGEAYNVKCLRSKKFKKLLEQEGLLEKIFYNEALDNSLTKVCKDNTTIGSVVFFGLQLSPGQVQYSGDNKAKDDGDKESRINNRIKNESSFESYKEALNFFIKNYNIQDSSEKVEDEKTLLDTWTELRNTVAGLNKQQKNRLLYTRAYKDLPEGKGPNKLRRQVIAWINTSEFCEKKFCEDSDDNFVEVNKETVADFAEALIDNEYFSGDYFQHMFIDRVHLLAILTGIEIKIKFPNETQCGVHEIIHEICKQLDDRKNTSGSSEESDAWSYARDMMRVRLNMASKTVNEITNEKSFIQRIRAFVSSLFSSLARTLSGIVTSIKKNLGFHTSCKTPTPPVSKNPKREENQPPIPPSSSGLSACAKETASNKPENL